MSATAPRRLVPSVTDGIERASDELAVPDVERAYRLGAHAFARGAMCVPIHDRDLVAMFTPGAPVGSSLPLLDAWHRGWAQANLADPCAPERA